MANTKIVIIVSNFAIAKDNTPNIYDFRETPELDKLLSEGWSINQIIPVVNQGSTNSSYLGSMQVIIKLAK
jgi:hypothetical protein